MGTSLIARKKQILAKVESAYGTDSTPTGSANAVLAKGIQVNPVQATLVNRDLYRPYFGNSEQLMAEIFVQMSFEVEMVGTGIIGQVPGYDPLLRACGFAKTIHTAAITITQTAGVATATKTAHGYKIGEKVLISGAVETAYNGVQTITAVTTNTFSFSVAGGTASPATGSPVINTDVTYLPVSDNLESSTLYYNVDGLQHSILGARGTVEFGMTVKQIPTMKFNFTGLYQSPTDTAAVVCDFSNFAIPEIVNTQNTPGFSLFGYNGRMQSMSLNMSNEVNYIARVGYEQVGLLDRKPQGSLVFDAPRIADFDVFTKVKNSTSGALTIDHGLVNGKKVSFSMPSVLLGNPNYSTQDGIEMLTAPFTIQPVSGNDEFSIVIK